MPADANLVLQASVTKTATFNSAGVDLGTGTPRGRTLTARVLYSAASNASGSNTVAFTVDHSDDNSTFYQLATNAENNLTLSTTAAAGEIFIPFETSKRYVRLTETLSGSGTSPTVTYQGDILLSHP
jgi:hypothetical protein